MTDWMPIKTASKKEPVLGYYRWGERSQRFVCEVEWSEMLKGWLTRGTAHHIVRVTHWQPLPPPPEETR